MSPEEFVELTRQRLTKSIGENWLRDVSYDELENFARYCHDAVIYRMTGNEDIQGHAFRGYKRGLEYAKKQRETK